MAASVRSKSIRPAGLGAYAASCLALVIALAVAPSPAAAQQVRNLEAIGLWRIYVADTSRGPLCGAQRDYGDITVYVKRSSVNRTGFIEFYNRNWRSVRDGARYRVEIDFRPRGSGPYFSDDALGVNDGDGRPGITFNLSRDFIRDFRARSSMRATLGGSRALGSFRLNGSRRAMDALDRCYARFVTGRGGGGGGRSTDPFSGL